MLCVCVCVCVCVCCVVCVWVDHHAFIKKDIPNGTVIMTEKDAVKCTQIAHDDCWYLPVSAQLTTQFESQLLQKLKQVTANKNKLREYNGL